VHQVDHIIELQVVSQADQEAWADTFDNYELLDSSSNASSGAQMARNIATERAALAAFYTDPSWLTCILNFDEIVPTGSGGGHRWSADEIIAGRHIAVFRRYRRW
jgi:hypothetical protein